MRMPLVGNKADHVASPIKNADTVQLKRGQPVVLNVNGTDDGLAVVLPSTAGAAKSASFLYGVSVHQPEVNQVSEAIVSGVCPFVLVVINTRSASSVSWATGASVASGLALLVDTANNAFGTAAAFGSGSMYMPYAVLLDTIGTQAGSASATSDTRLAATAGFRAFIRML